MVNKFPHLSLRLSSLAPPVWVTTGGAYSGPPVFPAHRILGTGAQGMLMARGSPQQGLVPLPLHVPYSEARGHSKLWASAGAQGQRLASSNSSLRCLGFLTGVEKAFLVKMVLLLSTYGSFQGTEERKASRWPLLDLPLKWMA